LKEKLHEHALIAEIVGGIAIVCSLQFVGVQIRQNSEISEINAYQDLISQITLMNSLRVQDAQFAGLFWRFDHGEQPRSDAECAILSPSLQRDYVDFVEEIGLLCGSYTDTGSYCEPETTPDSATR